MELHIKVPEEIDKITQLRVGDILYVTGKVFTARDEAHEHMLKMAEKGEKVEFDTSNMILYHCGPVMKKNHKWKAVAAGPTTSARMELFEKEFIEHYKTRIIVGKGTMGNKTAQALKEIKGVYATFTGGAGALAATSFEEVENVYWLEELGMPEAVWIFNANDFGPLVISIDSTGNNWNAMKQGNSEKIKEEIFREIDKN
ncbi:MAG: FumA C-terminus/TtdB family hydratase beta subunit [Thermoplasmata archaeon]|jgi:tartrate/fumarate subfamily iron-sulfur-dependent hydro-lyase beta chain